VLAGRRISVTDAAQLDGTFLCRLHTCEFNGLVTGQTFLCYDRTALDNAGFRFGLQTSDKKNFPFSVNWLYQE
jgi:hypothetical protein